MANKSVLNIEVNDVQFKAFSELFKQFKGQLGEIPAEWDRINDSASHSHEALAAAMGVITESMVASKDHARDLSQYIKDAVEAQKQFRLVTQHGENGLKAMTKHAKELKDTLFGAGKLMLKIGALGFGAVAGGLFGLDKLAQHAVANQRNARGLGLTTGQLRAWQTDIGARYMDEGALERVNDARSDPAKRAMLKYGLRIGDTEMDKMDVGELAAQVAIKAHDWWVSTPESQRNPYVYQASGLADAEPFESARFHGKTPRGELTRSLDQYRRDAAGLNISDQDTDKLYTFSRQVELAGRNLETYFTRKLADLGEPLGQFITNLEKDAEMLLDGILTPSNMEAIKSGIDDFAKYLGSQEFRDSAQKFLEALGVLGKAIMKVARLVAPSDDDNSSDYSTSDLYLNPERYHQEEVAPGAPIQVLNKPHPKGPSVKSSATVPASSMEKVPMAEAAAYFKELEAKYRLPEGILSATAEAESSFNPGAISNKGAKGLMQLTPETAKSLGVSNPFDWRQSAEGGAKLFAELQDRYKGDIRKEIAAWNWNPKGVNSSVDANGANWESRAPTETKNHIKRVLDLMARNQNKPAKVDVTLTNKAGTAVAVSTNAGSL